VSVAHGRSRDLAVTGVVIATAAAVGATGSPVVAALVAGVVVLLLLTGLPTGVLVGLFVASTFVTRFGIEVAGRTVRAEYVAGVLLALSLLPRYARAPFDQRARAVLLMLTAYLLYSTAVTVLFAPAPAASATVLIWFASDCLILLALVRVPDLVPRLVRWGTCLACGTAVIGVSAWLLANAGGPQLLVQPDPAYGGLAAYGLSYEANIFAGITCTWAMVALVSPRAWVPSGVRVSLIGLAPVVALVSHTRAALIALGAGVLVLLLVRSSGQVRRKIMPALLAMGALGSVVLVAGVPGTGKIVDKFSQSLDVNSANTRLRIDNSLVAVDDLRPSTAILGLGTNSYGQRHLQQAVDGSLVPSYIGNLPLQVLYDTGLVGLLIIGIGLWVASRKRALPGPGAAVLTTLFAVSLATSFFWFAATWVLVLVGCADLTDESDPPGGVTAGPEARSAGRQAVDVRT